MSRDSWLKELRVAGSDASAIGVLLAAGAPDDGLQHAGQAVLGCLPTAALLATLGPLIEQLNRRNWVGDAELIAELEHARAGTPAELTMLAVELDVLGEALEESPGSESFIDLASGTLWPAELFEVGQGPEDFDADDSGRWLLVRGLGSSATHAVMRRFIATVDSPGLASRLTNAASGSGAFGRFNAELSRHDDEYTRWHRFRDDARLGQARAWLADHGYRSTR